MSDKIFDLDRKRNDARVELFGQRIMIMFTETFEELVRGIEEVIGSEVEGVLYDAGINSGKSSIQILLRAWKERGKDFLKKWGEFYSSSGVGWFKIERMDINLNSGTGFIRIKQSLSSTAYHFKDNNVGNDPKSGRILNPMCHFLTGFFVGTFENLSGKKLECKEIKCIGKKDSYCEFALTNYE